MSDEAATEVELSPDRAAEPIVTDDAHSLAGGIEAWAAAGRPVEPEDGEVSRPPPAS